MPIRQFGNSIAAHLITGLAANKAVGGTDRSRDSRCPTSPRHGSGVYHRTIVPITAAYDKVAIRECCYAPRSNVVTGMRSTQRTDEGPRRAVEEVDRSRIGPSSVVIWRCDDDVARR